jgi:hypothetical protein
MNINNVANDIIDHTISFFTRLDLLILSKVNKKFTKCASDKKYKYIVIWNKNTACIIAARDGYFDVLKYLRKIDCRWDYRTCTNAARNGHLEILKWAYANGCEMCVSQCIREAKRKKQKKTIKWLESQINRFGYYN